MRRRETSPRSSRTARASGVGRTSSGRRSRWRALNLGATRRWSIFFDGCGVISSYIVASRTRSGRLDLLLGSPTEQFLLCFYLEAQFSGDSFRIECDDLGWGQVECDPRVHGEAITMCAEEVKRVQIGEAAGQRTL